VGESLLVLNAGSSSLKFCVFGRRGPEAWHAEARGKVESIGSAARFRARDARDQVLIDRTLGAGAGDAGAALGVLTDWLATTSSSGRMLGVGHRVVHGGPQRDGPAIVTPAVIAELRELSPLAPLHQPQSLAAIEALSERMPGVPQVACFDTSFHRGQPEVASVVPLPREVCRAGVQRYGFHGLSYEYIASVLPEVAPEAAGGRVIVAHLGSGASLCALRAGRSIDSTFGFSPLDGLCMGTRPGAIDPGVILYLFKTLGLSASQVEDMLYTKSGLLGISGISSDMRDLLESTEPAAKLAVDFFVYRASREIGALAAVLGGIDALVFTGGIGENSAEVRARICAASAWLGIELDPEANAAGSQRISQASSRTPAWVIATNEEVMIARHASAVLGLD